MDTAEMDADYSEFKIHAKAMSSFKCFSENQMLLLYDVHLLMLKAFVEMVEIFQRSALGW